MLTIVALLMGPGCGWEESGPPEDVFSGRLPVELSQPLAVRLAGTGGVRCNVWDEGTVFVDYWSADPQAAVDQSEALAVTVTYENGGQAMHYRSDPPASYPDSHNMGGAVAESVWLDEPSSNESPTTCAAEFVGVDVVLGKVVGSAAEASLVDDAGADVRIGGRLWDDLVQSLSTDRPRCFHVLRETVDVVVGTIESPRRVTHDSPARLALWLECRSSENLEDPVT